MKNKTTAQRLAQVLDEKRMLPSELATKSGVSKASISQYINGSHAPSNISSAKMGNVLGVNPLWLMGFDVPKVVEKYDPLKGADYSKLVSIFEAAAGEGRTTEWYTTEESSFIVPDDSSIVRVAGRSMEPTLLDGDIVVVVAQSVLDFPRQIALVKINGDEATLKRVEIKDNGIMLIADNVDVYPPHFYTSAEVEQLPVSIEGVVVQLIRDMK